MEWQEILDVFNKDMSRVIRDKDMHAMYSALDKILGKLASEEAKKPQEPVKDGFRLERYCDRYNNKGYNFTDLVEDKCFIEKQDYNLHLGMENKYMILTEEMVRALLPLLQEFVDKGEIS